MPNNEAKGSYPASHATPQVKLTPPRPTTPHTIPSPGDAECPQLPDKVVQLLPDYSPTTYLRAVDLHANTRATLTITHPPPSTYNTITWTSTRTAPPLVTAHPGPTSYLPMTPKTWTDHIISWGGGRCIKPEELALTTSSSTPARSRSSRPSSKESPPQPGARPNPTYTSIRTPTYTQPL